MDHFFKITFLFLFLFLHYCCQITGINGQSISSTPGNCKTRNIIYLVLCKSYVLNHI